MLPLLPVCFQDKWRVTAIYSLTVEHFLPKRSLVFVQWFKTFMVVTLVAVWSLASNHCRLELLSAFSFVACGDQADCTGKQDKDCETDGCATVENQLYKSENAQVQLPAPALLAAVFASSVIVEESNLSLPRLFDTTPKVLSRLWQFSYRTALPPRAPSHLS